MSNENQKHENKPENEQPSTTPAAQVELSDEDLEQVVGGVVIIDCDFVIKGNNGD